MDLGLDSPGGLELECDLISSPRTALAGVGRRGCRGEKPTPSLPSPGSFSLPPPPPGRPVLSCQASAGPADSWLWVPGSELSQPRAVTEQIRGAGPRCSRQGKAATPTPSHLLLGAHPGSPRSPWGRPHGASLGVWFHRPCGVSS